MTVIFLLIPLSIAIAAAFLGAFIWAVKTGQYEDTCTPSMRVLLEDAGPTPRGDSRHDALEPGAVAVAPPPALISNPSHKHDER